MLSFATACILLIITPGPGVLSVAGVGSGYGFKAASIFLCGLCLGNFLVGLLVVSGVAAAVLAVPLVRPVLLTLSALYMLYLAMKVAFAGSKIGFMEADTSPRFRDGAILQLINPKCYVANTVLFTGFGFMPENLTAEIFIKFVIWTSIWIPIHYAWLLAGVGLRRMNVSPTIQRAINYTMAISLVIVVGLALWTSQG